MAEITDEFVITSCGKISRETFAIKDRPRNFYVQGSMGCCLPLAIGVALSCPANKVVVIIGDGEALMGLDSLVLLKKVQEKYVAQGLEMAMPYIREADMQKANQILDDSRFNLDLYILDNNKYDSTGGQKTISDVIDFRVLCECKVIYVQPSDEEYSRITLSHKEIKERFEKTIGERVQGEKV